MEFNGLAYFRIVFIGWCLLLMYSSALPQTGTDTLIVKEARYYNGIDEPERKTGTQEKIWQYLKKEAATQDLDSVLIYLNRSMALITSSGDDFFLPEIYIGLAAVHYNTGNEQMAKKYADLLLELATQHDLPEYLFFSNRLLGMIYNFRLNDQNSAFQYYQQALEYAQDEATSIQIKLDMALMYTDYFVEHKDSEYADIVLVFRNEIEEYLNTTSNKDTFSERDRYKLLYLSHDAHMFFSDIEEEYDVRIKYANQALEDAYVLDSMYADPHAVSSALYTLVSIHTDNGEYKLARSRLKEGLVLAKQRHDKVNIYQAYISLATMDYKLQDYRSTINYLDSVKPFEIDRAYYKTIDSLYYKSYLKLKNYEQATVYAEKYIAIVDSVNTAEKEDAYVEFGKKYQTEKKIRENQILTQENEIKDLLIVKERNKRYFLSALSMLAFVILIVLYYFYRNKQKTTRILQDKNETISDQIAALEEANITKQKFFSIISHDLVNPFNAMLGYAQLLDTRYDEFDNMEKKEFIGNIHTSAARNYKLVKSLLDWGRAQENTIVAKKEELNCKDLIDLACEPYFTFARQKDIEIINDAPADLDCFADKNMMITGIGNIINNAIKFTPRGGVVRIEAHSDEDKVYLKIKDNGVGISLEKMTDLFAMDKVTSSPGTNDEPGTGFGLMITKEFMKKQGGDILVSQNTPRGTVFTLVV